jgi:hypothetical protein
MRHQHNGEVQNIQVYCYAHEFGLVIKLWVTVTVHGSTSSTIQYSMHLSIFSQMSLHHFYGRCSPSSGFPNCSLAQPQQFSVNSLKNTFQRRLKLFMSFTKAVSSQTKLNPVLQWISRIITSRNGPPENTIPLFFHCCKHYLCNVCLSMAVVLLFA